MPYRALAAFTTFTTFTTLTISFLLSGCAAPVYTVDDGSPVDEKLLSSIRLYGKGEQTIRSHIIKSAQLKDEGCDKQWELPFVVATSYDLPKEERIARARGLQVDERLSITAATQESGLQVGDKIEKINGDDEIAVSCTAFSQFHPSMDASESQ